MAVALLDEAAPADEDADAAAPFEELPEPEPDPEELPLDEVLFVPAVPPSTVPGARLAVAALARAW